MAPPSDAGEAPTRRLGLALLACILTACAGAPAVPQDASSPEEAVSPRRYVTIPGQGALGIDLPEEWELEAVERRPGEDAPAVTFVITPPDGGRFRLELAPLERPDGGEAPPALEEARGCAEGARAGVAGRSAERELPLRPLESRGGALGYYFVAIDRELLEKEPSPEEWRGTLQGCAVVGELLLGFAAFDDLPGEHRRRLLQAVAGARHLPPVAEEEPLELPGELARIGTELRASYPGRGWSVAVSLAGFPMVPPHLAGGASVEAAAFDPGSGIRVALRLRDGAEARSAAACRAPEWARLLGGAGELRGGRTWETGDAAWATYVRPGSRSDGGPREVARAWYFRDGVCVRVELSVPFTGRGAPGGYEMILRTIRFVEEATPLQP